MRRLIERFWDQARLVCRAQGNYGTPFRARRGVTQGGPLSPTLFNLLVDAVVREWLRTLYGAQVSSEWAAQVRRELFAIFYVDDALVASRDPVTLQRAVDVLVALFECVGLRTNTKKTKVCTFVPGKIRTRLSTAAYSRRADGLQSRKDWERRRVKCDKCGADLATSSLREHSRT